ncbi:hypothetical protein NDU88_005554 [Pleurodeles waltl]|uniref:Uncharacterized protein n=1 Tax=Pleurodeles waltl TaxID=8319 RepID=A0AAV7RNL6_PLEWA|nr:hypothetical protein NDU88_005554 [Pleurodeles waltl]
MQSSRLRLWLGPKVGISFAIYGAPVWARSPVPLPQIQGLLQLPVIGATARVVASLSDLTRTEEPGLQSCSGPNSGFSVSVVSVVAVECGGCFPPEASAELRFKRPLWLPS